MLGARAVLPATVIGSVRPGKDSSALMTFEAASPIFRTGMELARSWRALLEAESMGGVSGLQGRPPGLAVNEGQSSQSTRSGAGQKLYWLCATAKC